MSIPTATFTKLRSGAWGVKGTGLVGGHVATVTKRDGRPTTVTVDRVIWSGSGVQIASILAPTSRGPARSLGNRCQECGRGGAHWAHDLSGIGGWACDRCDDGSLSFC